MDSVYVFKGAPSSIKRLIHLYLIGLGTPTSQLIKEEYDKLFEANKHNIIVTRHMSMYEARDVGFIGLYEVMKVSSKKSTNGEYHKDLFKKYYNGITASEDLLLPQQVYETNTAKLFYIYNCTNTPKFQIIMSIYGDNRALEKLLKYKYLQLKSEEII
jgi:hypothetical protein